MNILPKILSHSIGEKWLRVEWFLVDNDAIVNIVIKVFSSESGSERSFAFESGKRDGIIPLETDAGLVNLTLVSIDTCGTEHSSAQYHVDIEEPVSTLFASIIKSGSEATSSFCPTASSAPDKDCNPGKGDSNVFVSLKVHVCMKVKHFDKVSTKQRFAVNYFSTSQVLIGI